MSRQDGCVYDSCVKAEWVVILLMCQGCMGDYITYVSNQDGCLSYFSMEDGFLYYLCVMAGWVVIILLCQGRMGAFLTHLSRQDGWL